MARLYLFAEGQTEQTFATDVLAPHLAARGVYLQAAVLIAHARKKGRTHRGGGRDYGPMRRDILRFIRQESGPDVFFTTMIDLYALHHDFPGRQESERLRHMPYERVAFLEGACSEDIDDARFIPYIQLHEFEACLFTKPDEFALFYEGEARGLRRLAEISEKYDNPELINDGSHTAPSKRIIKVFPDYKPAKRTIGPMVAELIGLDRIRSKCRHFHEWVTRLEELGAAGN